jgi:hypothetical protein
LTHFFYTLEMPGKRKSIQIPADAVSQRYQAGASMAALAREYGVCPTRISAIIKSAGIAVRTVSETLKGNRHARRMSASQDTLFDLYVTQKKTVKEIASITGCKNAFRHLKAANIPMRGHSETRKGKPAPISPVGMERMRLANSGPNNHGWKGGLLSANARAYQKAEWRCLRARVVQRDNFTCQFCGESFPSPKLRVHHLRPR